MRKDHILTEEEKLSKQQRLEENRRLRTRQAHPLPPTSPPTVNRTKPKTKEMLFCFS